jgi:hypothetical protein
MNSVLCSHPVSKLGSDPNCLLLSEWGLAGLLECGFDKLLVRKAHSLRQQVVPIDLLRQAYA